VNGRRVPVERLRVFVVGILEAQGVSSEHAAVTADRMIEADLRGRSGHGIIRLGQYSRRIRAGGYNLDPVIRVMRETPVSALVDGDNALGQVVMTRAAQLAIDKAERSGIGWVATVNSNHAGAAGIYPAMAMRSGLGAFYFAVANANGMAPWGGIERLLGTNPIAFAIPAGSETPFQLDMATTVASHGTIEVVAQTGEVMPEGWVVDREGRPVTDPAKASEGFLMPIGGYKGSGLNIMIGLLAGVMTGAAFGSDVVQFRDDHTTPTNTGQSIIAFRPDLFAGADEVADRMDTKLRELRGSASATDQPVRLPGEGVASREADNRALGLSVPDGLIRTLNDLARSVGVTDTPWGYEATDRPAPPA
jgi:LDH2 family malate/lactate/ureidoglycolate dehydrogenase